MQQAVGADDDVDFAGLQAGYDLLLLFGGAETAQDFDADGEGAEAVGEGGIVLLGEDGGGNEDAYLHSVTDGLESGSQGDFGFAVAYIAADQAVHRALAFHIGFDVGDGLGLVGGFDVGEGVLEFLLPSGVGAEFVAFGELAGGVGADEFLRHFAGGALDALLDAGPVGGAEAGKGGGVFLGADVGAYAVEVVGGDVEFVVFGVFQY